MRSLMAGALLALLAVPAGSGAAPPIRASFVEGDVQALADAARHLGKDERPAPKAPWKKLQKGSALGIGDAVRTAAGARVELVLADGSKVRLGPSSSLLLREVQAPKKGRAVSLKLWIGRLWAKVARRAAGESRFEVRTHNAVAGVRGTSFAVVANGDLSSLVKVYSGTVGVKKNRGYAGRRRREVPGPTRVDRKQWEEVILTSMRQVKVTAVGDIAPAEDFFDQGEDLQWAMWNQERDRAVQ